MKLTSAVKTTFLSLSLIPAGLSILPSPVGHPLLPWEFSCGNLPSLITWCMADPAVDHGINIDEYGHVDILRSPFFDVGFGFNDNAEDYLNRILPTLIDSLDEQLIDYEWIILGRSPAPPTPAPSPATSPLGIACVLVVSFSLLIVLFR